MPLDENRMLGKYQIIRLLGTGGMGEVYLAEDVTLRRKVAIKLIADTFADTDNSQNELLREARILAGLSHPNLLTIFDFEVIEGKTIVVTEFLQGKTLKQEIENIERWKSQKILREILEGLEYAHSRNVFHLDLKPENILLTSEGKVKILDFGLARLRDSIARANADQTVDLDPTNVTSIKGTPAYMAPEIWWGQRGDSKSDIYSFGCIMFEMLAKKKLNTGITNEEKRAQALNSSFDLERRTSSFEEWEVSLIKSCVSIDAKKRPPSIRDIDETFRNPRRMRIQRLSTICGGIILILGLLVAWYYLSKVKPHSLNNVDQLLANAESDIDAGRDNEGLTKLNDLINNYRTYSKAYIDGAIEAMDLGKDNEANKFITEGIKNTDPKSIDSTILFALKNIYESENKIGYDMLLKLYQQPGYKMRTLELYELSDVAIDRQVYDIAESAVEACLSLNSKSHQCRYQSSILNIARGNAQKVIADFNSSVEISDWQDIPIGIAYLVNDKHKEARNYFIKLSTGLQEKTETKQDITEAWITEIYLLEGKYKEAERRLLEAGNGQENEAESRQKLAEFYSLIGQNQKATAIARELLRTTKATESITDPLIILARSSLGNPTLLSVVEKENIKGISREKERFHIYALIDMANGDNPSMILNYSKAIDPDNPKFPIMFDQGRGYMLAKRWDDAIESFLKIINQKGKAFIKDDAFRWTLSNYYISKCFEATGDKQQEKEYLSEFVKVTEHADSDNTLVNDARNRLAKLEVNVKPDKAKSGGKLSTNIPTEQEKQRRARLLSGLQKEYFLSNDGFTSAELAGTEITEREADWINRRLHDKNEGWTVQPTIKKIK